MSAVRYHIRLLFNGLDNNAIFDFNVFYLIPESNLLFYTVNIWLARLCSGVMNLDFDHCKLQTGL